jgi:5-methylcytosine-specific restriction endonuclease McrA
VARSSVKVPPIFASQRAQAAFKKAKAFYEPPPNSRLQRRHQFDFGIWKDNGVRDGLFILFNDKCASCESKVAPTGYGEVDQFRPKGGAYNLDKNFAPDHYWWLAYDWRNHYLACRICNANKGSHFPVKNQRAKVPKGEEIRYNALWFWESLKNEQPLLLDPCQMNPGDHLLFDKRGIVAPLTEEGQVTVEILKLNRNELVKERKLAALQTNTVLTSLSMTLDRKKTLPSKLLEEIRGLQSTSQPYAAVRRACVRGLASTPKSTRP